MKRNTRITGCPFALLALTPEPVLVKARAEVTRRRLRPSWRRPAELAMPNPFPMAKRHRPTDGAATVGERSPAAIGQLLCDPPGLVGLSPLDINGVLADHLVMGDQT